MTLSPRWILAGLGLFLLLSMAALLPTGQKSKRYSPTAPEPARADPEWYSGGHLATAAMSEWMQASEHDRLATAADFASKALEGKYGSHEAAMRELGTMENLRPYATQVETCITAVGHEPADSSPKRWDKVLEILPVNDIGAACLVKLKYQE